MAFSSLMDWTVPWRPPMVNPVSLLDGGEHLSVSFCFLFWGG